MRTYARLVIGTFVVLAACSDSNGPHGLAITVAPAAESIRAGEKVAITITITNVAAVPQTVDLSPGTPGVLIFNSAGQQMPQPGFWTADYVARRLMPGETATLKRAWWGRTFDSNGASLDLPAGEYRLVGTIRSQEFGILQNGAARVFIVP